MDGTANLQMLVDRQTLTDDLQNNTVRRYTTHIITGKQDVRPWKPEDSPKISRDVPVCTTQ
jgi:hypothetical protein